MNYRHKLAIHPRRTDLSDSSWLDVAGISQVLGERVTTDVADLLDVAVGVYSADRMSPRDFSGSRTGQRSIVVELPYGIRTVGTLRMWPHAWRSISIG